MVLIKKSAIGALDFGSRAISMLIIMKFAVIFGGSAGLALFGQFQNFSSILLLLGGGVLATGVLKSTAQLKKKPERLLDLWNTSFTLSLIASTLLIVLFITFPFEFLKNIAGFELERPVFVAALLFLFPAALQANVFSIANGLESSNLLLKTRLIATFCFLVSFLLLLHFKDLNWALVSVTLAPFISSILIILEFHRLHVLRLSDLRFQLDDSILGDLVKNSLIAIVSAISLPTTLLLARTLILKNFGADVLGNWEGAFRIGDQYLILITSIIGIYFLPRFARAKLSIGREVRTALGLSLILSILGGAFILFLKRPIVDLLLNSSFTLAQDLLLVQITTSILKICSWVFAYVMIMRGQYVAYAIGEVLTSILLFALIYIFTDWSIHWVNGAFLMAYVFYFAYCLLVYQMTKPRKSGVGGA